MIKEESNYFKCKSTEYSTFLKNRIYHKDLIGKYLISEPNDWVLVPSYPTYQEIIEIIEIGDDVQIKKLLKLLKIWRKEL